MAPRALTAATMGWPRVLGEVATLDRLLLGDSLARFGDGEFKSAYNREQQWQPPSLELAAELREILWNPAQRCLVGIPTLDTEGPKLERWHKLYPMMLPLLRADVRYASAFVGRPDHAPWTDNPGFKRRLEMLWAGKIVAVVASPEDATSRKTYRVRRSAYRVLRIDAPATDAYSVIEQLEEQCLIARSRAGAELALLSCGVAATCLADRLAGQGMQAIDVGTLGKRMLLPYLEKGTDNVVEDDTDDVV